MLTFSNSEELLKSAIDLGTSIEICSAALDKNDISAKQLRKDIKITIGGLVSTVSEDLSNRKEKDLIFIWTKCPKLLIKLYRAVYVRL